MDILLINQYAGSSRHGMEYRHFYLAREWVSLGHSVTIIAASFSHLHSVSPVTADTVTEENIEGIRYFWLKTPKYEGNGFMRVVNMISFSLKLLTRASKFMHRCKPDIVIASSPQPFVIFGAQKIARSYGAKLCFEVRDLWPLSLIELGGISPLHPFIWIMQWTENYAYRVADYVISLLPKADQYMIDHGMAPEKFVYLPNGIDVAEWNDNKQEIPEYHRETLEALRQKGCFIVGYTGAMGISNALDTLINAALLMKNYPVVFVLVGKGPEKEVLQRRVEELALVNVVFLPPVEKVVIPELLSEMDALFIGWNREPLYRFGVSPNKLMDYLMAAKPIIHAIEAGNDMVAESGCGISVPPEAPGAIAEAVATLINMTLDERDRMGLKGKAHVMEYHDYRMLANRFFEKING